MLLTKRCQTDATAKVSLQRLKAKLPKDAAGNAITSIAEYLKPSREALDNFMDVSGLHVSSSTTQTRTNTAQMHMGRAKSSSLSPPVDTSRVSLTLMLTCAENS